MHHLSRQICVCTSLAYLLFAGAWLELFRVRETAPAAVHGERFAAYFGATMLNVVAVALGMFLVSWAASQRNNARIQRYGQCAFLLLSTFAFDSLMLALSDRLSKLLPEFALQALWGLLLAIPILGCILVALYGNYRILGAVTTTLLFLAPMLPLNGATILLSLLKPAPKEEARAPVNSQKQPTRVVWIIFDELDQRLSFEARPENVDLPELDRLRAESFFATAAAAPAAMTKHSMPALLTGIAPTKDELDRSELHLANARIQGGRTIFQEVRELGGTAAIAGWYFDYCSSVGQHVAACVEPPRDLLMSSSVAANLSRQWAMQAETNWLATRFTESGRARMPWFGWADRVQQRAEFEYLVPRAMELVKNPAYDMVLLHLPIPHPLGIYDRRSRRVVATSESNYLDNLALADQTLGEIRNALKASGVMNRTALIVSSDHPLRVEVWSESVTWTEEEARATSNRKGRYVPFLAQLPGDRSGISYSKPFNTLLSKDFVIAVLRNQLASHAALTAWIEARNGATQRMASSR